MSMLKRLGGLSAALVLGAGLAAPTAMAAHNKATPPGNPDQCQETGGYAADERRPAAAKADDDAGQNGQNVAVDKSPAIGAGTCPA